MTVKFDTYSIYARFFPTLVVALPIFVLWFFISELADLKSLVSYILSLKFFGSITFAVVFIYLYAQLIRTTSIAIEKKYFLNSNGFPTTYFMMYRDDTYSTEFKDAFRRRVQSFFGLTLLTEAQEIDNTREAKKRLDEVTKLIILKVGDGKLVKKHNIWYGFFRNLIGGILYAIIFCVINLIIGTFYLNNVTLWASSIVLLVPYIAVVIFHKPILFQHAEAYAKQLIAEFMSIS